MRPSASISTAVGVPLVPLDTMRYDDASTRHVCYAFGVTYDGPIAHQADEVAWGGWMTPEDLCARLADPAWPFVPDGRVLIERLLAEPG